LRRVFDAEDIHQPLVDAGVGIEDPAERHTGDDEAQRVGEQEYRAEEALGDGHPMDEYRQHQAGHDGEDQEQHGEDDDVAHRRLPPLLLEHFPIGGAEGVAQGQVLSGRPLPVG
jgi:hypothetical protein